MPLFGAMGARVRTAGSGGVVLTAPLVRNVNDRATAFGGSIAALAMLSGWALVHLRLGTEGVGANAVLQRGEVTYLQPIRADFEARAQEVDEGRWRRFRSALRRWGRGRVHIEVEVWCGDVLSARLEADYVALRDEDRPESAAS